MRQPNPRRGLFVALLMVVAISLTAAFIVPAGPTSVSAAGPVGPAGAGSRAVGDASNGWNVAFSAPGYPNGEGFHFYGMIFVTRDVGFAFGGQSWNAPDTDSTGKAINPGRVYRTRNGGATWQLVHESRGWKIGMACADELRCWVGGKRGQIFYTTDGGDVWFGANEYTWQGMDLYPTPAVQTPVPFTAWIRSAGITTDGSKVIFGATDNTILSSNDGVNFYNYWPLLSWYSATWSVTCPTETVCYGGQIKRFVIKSTDSGASWSLPAYVGPKENDNNCLVDKYPSEGIQRRYYGLAFVNESYGWAVGSCGSLYRTVNGSVGWQAQNANLPQEVSLRRVQAFSKSSALAAGGTNPDPNDASMALNAVVYRTTDGANWSPVAAPDTSVLHGLSGFADATFVADWSGNIWRWDGELVPIAPTNTPTATSTVTETPEATETPTATPTATVTSFPEGSIEVVAFNDINSNGQPDDAAPLPNVGFEVRLSATPVATGATGSDGRHLFNHLGAGEYVVAITTPAVGYTANTSQLIVGLSGQEPITLPFPHRMSTVTPTHARTWLPMLVR